MASKNWMLPNVPECNFLPSLYFWLGDILRGGLVLLFAEGFYFRLLDLSKVLNVPLGVFAKMLPIATVYRQALSVIGFRGKDCERVARLLELFPYYIGKQRNIKTFTKYHAGIIHPQNKSETKSKIQN